MASSEEEQVMIVGVDLSDHSLYALEWTLDRFFASYAPNPPFKLIVVHAKPSPAFAVGLVSPGAEEILLQVDYDLKKVAARVCETAKEMCLRKSVNDVTVEIFEGDARNVLCEVIEKRHASLLVVGSHGYGAIKRAVIGSVSDYCAHHAHCSVMIVKKHNMKS